MKHESTDYLSLAEAASRAPGHPHVSAIWRWCRRGLKTRAGQVVRLTHIRAGARLFIRPDDLFRFFEEVAEADAAHFATPPVPGVSFPKGRTPKQRERAIAEAKAILDRAGV